MKTNGLTVAALNSKRETLGRSPSYLNEALADVAGAEGLVAAGAQGQSRQEEDERGGGGGGEDQLTGPHPDGSPAPTLEKHLHQHRRRTGGLSETRGSGGGWGSKTNKQNPHH